MKLSSFLSALVLSCMVSLAHAVDPDELNRITFENNTGYDFHYLFLSPGDSEHWGTDILGSSTIMRDGDVRGFYIHYPDRCNTFDIMAIDEDDDAYILWDYEICDSKSEYIEFTLADLNDDAPDFDLVTLNLRNDTGYDMVYIFFSPDDSEMWGVDQLDDETILRTGETLSLLLPATSKRIGYDVHTVDEDEDTYTFSVEIDNGRSEWTFPIELSDLD